MRNKVLHYKCMRASMIFKAGEMSSLMLGDMQNIISTRLSVMSRKRGREFPIFPDSSAAKSLFL